MERFWLENSIIPQKRLFAKLGTDGFSLALRNSSIIKSFARTLKENNAK
ncbi:MAG: hypothetical protein GXO60_01170 [Epsilonproteobacteria bacterium]|nr:hypothetical protein [Campylobacterota bacterium]